MPKKSKHGLGISEVHSIKSCSWFSIEKLIIRTCRKKIGLTLFHCKIQQTTKKAASKVVNKHLCYIFYETDMYKETLNKNDLGFFHFD